MPACKTPLCWPLFSYISGLLFVEYVPALSQWHYGYAIVGCLSCLLFGILCRNHKKLVYHATLAYASVAWLLLGIGMAQHLFVNQIPDVSFATNATKGYRAHVLKIPQRGTSRGGYVIHLGADLRYAGGTSFTPLHEKIRLKYHHAYCPFQVGDEVWIWGAPKRITASTQATARYNFARIQARQGIYFEDHATRKDLIKTGRKKGRWLWVQSQHLHKALQERLKHDLSREAAAMAQGLLLGDKKGMSQQLKKAFAATGSMHILAVSGLHVGILYGIWLIVARLFFPVGRYALVCRLLVAALGVWGFAFVVGLSASVIRASILCTLLVISKWLDRRGNLYNSLAAAALLILLIDPKALYSLSFQLSFLAVLGISCVYSPLYSLLPALHQLLRPIWAIVCVSLAAQVAVLPLLLYHFQLVSLIFPLTNILLIPLLSVALPLSLGLALFGAWEGVAHAVAWVLEYLLSLMSWIIETLALLPGSHLYPVHCSATQVGLLYGIFFCGICLWKTRKQLYIWVGVGLIGTYIYVI